MDRKQPKNSGAMRGLERSMESLNRFFMVIGGIALLLLMGLATANVLLRLFHIPFRGTYEFVSFFGAVATASALGYTQSKKGHILVNIVSERFPRRIRNFADGLSALLNGIFFSVIAWQIILWGAKLARTGEVSETLKVVYHPFVYAVALGFAALALTCLVDFLGNLPGAGRISKETPFRAGEEREERG